MKLEHRKQFFSVNSLLTNIHIVLGTGLDECSIALVGDGLTFRCLHLTTEGLGLKLMKGAGVYVIYQPCLQVNL